MDASHYASDVAFTPAVKAVQARKGSRDSYARMEAGGSWRTRITPDLARFVPAQTSVFLATASAEGQPYIQHRGGPPGFLRVLDDRPSALPISRATGSTSPRQSGGESAGVSVPDRLCAAAAGQALGQGARRRGGSRAGASADAVGLRGAGRAGDPVHGRGLGHQLPAAHPPALRGGDVAARARRARRANRGRWRPRSNG